MTTQTGLFTNINPPYKTLTKILLGKDWFELIEHLAPADQRDHEDSLYWQSEYLKAFSTKFMCDPITRDITKKHMLLAIGKW